MASEASSDQSLEIPGQSVETMPDKRQQLITRALQNPHVQRLYNLGAYLKPDDILPEGLESQENPQVAKAALENLLEPVSEYVHDYFGYTPDMEISDGQEFYQNFLPALAIDPETRKPLSTVENKALMYQRLIAFERKAKRLNEERLNNFPVLEQLRVDPKTGEELPLNSIRLNRELSSPSRKPSDLIETQVDQDVKAGKYPFNTEIGALEYAYVQGDPQLFNEIHKELQTPQHARNWQFYENIRKSTESFIKRRDALKEKETATKALEDISSKRSGENPENPPLDLNGFFEQSKTLPDLLKWIENCGNTEIQHMTGLLLGSAGHMTTQELFEAIKANAGMKLINRGERDKKSRPSIGAIIIDGKNRPFNS